ncbi:MAG: hypothetical protein IK106_03300 [Clostridiales bacterium]|nr:hypothetical protein [Clostridiales bacterium]
MDGLIWILALIMGASIGIGLAFLICALMLNKSNNKGDSRLKPEDYSTDIISFSDEDNMKHNRQQFNYLVDVNIETMCRSNEYMLRHLKALPFGSTEPVTRYIPDSKNDAAFEAANAMREPVIFSSDSLSASAFHKGLVLGLGTSITTSKFGSYRTLSGRDATAVAYNSLSGSGATTNYAAAATIASPASAPMGGVAPSTPMGGVAPAAPMGGMPASSPAAMPGTTAAIGGIPVSALVSGVMLESSWAAARRQNMGIDGRTAGRVKEVKIDPTAGNKQGRTMTQEEIDAFWNGGSTPAPKADNTSTDGGAAAPVAPAAPTAPAKPEPIYETPTATRPLWENSDSNDDFSDFSDLM